MNRPTSAAIATAMEMQAPIAPGDLVAVDRHRNVWCALAAAQAEFSAPKKDSTNPAFRSKYADLAAVVEAVAPALSRHGVAFVHYVDARDLGLGPVTCMVTALIHGPSDTRMECPVPLLLGKQDMQGFKSATTYAKRIGLESVTGVAPEDDDGNAAAKNPPPSRPVSVVEPVTRATVPNEAFETDDGTMSARKAEPYPPNATPAQKARIAADGIIREMREAKTAKGLDGVWKRHEGIISRLADSYPVEHGDVLDVFSTLMQRLEDAA